MTFDDFLMEVDPKYHWFVLEMQEYLLKKDCKLKITSAKSGYLASYQFGKKKRVILNFVFRKSGLIARIYCGYASDYEDYLETLPEEVKKIIIKAPSCKRFEDPPKCAPTCIGYVFKLDNTMHQKCKYNCFLLEVNDENIPIIKTLVEKELACREKE